MAKFFLFIRHAKTRSNLERRYVGNFNETLCLEGVSEAKALLASANLPSVTRLMSGAALRCRQTAEILFPNMIYETCPMVEIDFGIFKGKNADDLLDDKDYAKWLETSCMGDIPCGDSVSDFKERCCVTFKRITEGSQNGVTALVIHGGNIMAVLEKFALPKQDFYFYHIPNCGFILCRYESGTLHIVRNGGVL